MPFRNPLIYAEHQKEYKKLNPVFNREELRKRQLQLGSQAQRIESLENRPKSAAIGSQQYMFTDFEQYLQRPRQVEEESSKLVNILNEKRSNQHRTTAFALSKCLGDGCSNYLRQLRILSASNNEALVTKVHESNTPVLAIEQARASQESSKASRPA